MANTNVFELQAKSYVLMDAETGQILFGKTEATKDCP